MSEPTDHDCVQSGIDNTKFRARFPRPGNAVRCPVDGKCWQMNTEGTWDEIDPPGGVV